MNNSVHFPLSSCQMNSVRNGELYKYIADTRGAVVQPAFYQAFVLIVLEATYGLPTFANNQGGPAEIIVHGKSAFHIDPYHDEQAAELLADFFMKCKGDPSHWKPTPRVALSVYRRRNRKVIGDTIRRSKNNAIFH